MGGNAFENLRRLDKAEFEPYSNYILTILKEKFTKFTPLLYYREKESFGDLDILVAKPKLDRSEFEAWMTSKGVTEFHYNKDYVSFKYQDFQVDLIFVPEQFYETAYFYYSYNDLNNLVGRMAHKFGLKFGWDGLSYVIRTESGHKGEKLYLSLKPKEIYDFLGLDYAKWIEGFDSLESIFDFVATSPYFNPDIFSDEHLNHTNKTRNRKRKTYQLFKAWLEEHYNELHAYQYESDKSVYLIKIHNAFFESNLLGELSRYAQYIRDYDARAVKYNGHLVRDWTGLEGKELGQVIQEFRKYTVGAYPGDKVYAEAAGKDPFDYYLDYASAERVCYNFTNWFIFAWSRDTLGKPMEDLKELAIYKKYFSTASIEG